MSNLKKPCKVFPLLLAFIIAFILVLGNGCTGLTVSATATKITIKVNNKAVTLPYSPIIESNLILAPAQSLVKAMGASYKYDPKSKTITVIKAKTTIILKISSRSAKINNKTSNMPIAPKLVKVPFVPVKYIGEKLGYTTYSYNSKTKIAVLGMVAPKPTPSPDPTPIPQITVYLIGDSTEADYTIEQYPLMGWGQALPRFFDEYITLLNEAGLDKSAKSYFESDYWTYIKAELKPGDYLFMQFGANDIKVDTATTGASHTDPDTTYTSYLKAFIDYAKLKKAIPILLTPTCSILDFDANGVIQPSLGAYSNAMRSLGKVLKVPIIDLAAKSKALIESLGPEKSNELYMPDKIHFQETGAIEIAKLIKDSIKDVVGAPLSSHIIDG